MRQNEYVGTETSYLIRFTEHEVGRKKIDFFLSQYVSLTHTHIHSHTNKVDQRPQGSQETCSKVPTISNKQNNTIHHISK